MYFSCLSKCCHDFMEQLFGSQTMPGTSHRLVSRVHWLCCGCLTLALLDIAMVVFTTITQHTVPSTVPGSRLTG